MTGEDALVMIRAALTKVSPGAGDVITFETDLVEDGVLDSLDLMNFVFQLEQMRGTRIGTASSSATRRTLERRSSSTSAHWIFW